MIKERTEDMGLPKILFIDRDGTIITEPEDDKVDSFYKLRLLPNVIFNLRRISAELHFLLVMVSNQDGLFSDRHRAETFWGPQNLLIQILADEGVHFESIHIDGTLAFENSQTRKPGTAMLKGYLNGKYDLANSFVIGDRNSDVQLAKNLGAKAIFMGIGTDDSAVLSTAQWDEIYDFLVKLA